MEASTPIVTAAVLVGLGVLLLSWSLTTDVGATRRRTLANLQRNLAARRDLGDQGDEGKGGALVRAARRLTPQHAMSRLDRLLAGAGRPAAWPLERVLVTKLLLAVGLMVLCLLLIGSQWSFRAVVLLILVGLLGWFLPELLVYNSATKRRKAITRSLPDVLDQLTIAVEAGLGFEAALAHVGRNSPGPLGDELIRTLQDIQVGVPRHFAYRSLADRAQVDDLARFVRAIGQAEQYGVSVADVLEAQAREMRLKRRQRAEESAMKIPVKVVFPLTLFILPTLFIVILGPAVLSAWQTWTG